MTEADPNGSKARVAPSNPPENKQAEAPQPPPEPDWKIRIRPGLYRRRRTSLGPSDGNSDGSPT
jgi:hypothetical protein